MPNHKPHTSSPTLTQAAIDTYAVIGHPVSHSQSPWIHTEFARQTGQVLAYTHLPAPVEGFVETAMAFAQQGGKGLNVTIPFKQQAYAIANRLSARAALAGAVNTLRIECDGKDGAGGGIQWYGDNTDGVGLVRDLERHWKGSLQGAHLLLLGAGGAARGALAALIEARPARIMILNRTASRAQELAAHFAQHAEHHACIVQALDEIPKPFASPQRSNVFDIIINASAASLQGSPLKIDPHIWHADTLAYDMMYGAQPTPFMQQARHYGALAVDGLGMLVEQAAESFYLWRGMRPSVEPVLTTLRAAL